jgi:solute carrier family 31 (copper transporter), member 1
LSYQIGYVKTAAESPSCRCSGTGTTLTPYLNSAQVSPRGYTTLTLQAGFISSTRRIKSKAMFAGSCVDMICFVISLEMLHRLQRAHERYLIRQAKAQCASAERLEHSPISSESSRSNALDKDPSESNTHATPLMGRASNAASASHQFRPSLSEQTVRALMHMVQFSVAYFIMLLAMYYNSYFILCILIGAFLGFFIFAWDTANSAER